MITAHLPSGYLLARALRADSRPTLAATLTGAVFPDLDLIWFYLIDDRAFHHHHYWVHAPGFWAGIALILWLATRLAGRPFPRLAALFLAGITLHLLLDTIAGGIAWGWPISRTLIVLSEVPATRAHWILSFMTHWTFTLELAVWAATATLALRRQA